MASFHHLEVGPCQHLAIEVRVFGPSELAIWYGLQAVIFCGPCSIDLSNCAPPTVLQADSSASSSPCTCCFNFNGFRNCTVQVMTFLRGFSTVASTIDSQLFVLCRVLRVFVGDDDQLVGCNRFQVKSVYLIRRGARPVEKLHVSLEQLSPGASWQNQLPASRVSKIGHDTRMCIGDCLWPLLKTTQRANSVNAEAQTFSELRVLRFLCSIGTLWMVSSCRTKSLKLLNLVWWSLPPYRVTEIEKCQVQNMSKHRHTHKLFQLSLRSKRLYKLSLCHTPHNNKKNKKHGKTTNAIMAPTPSRYPCEGWVAEDVARSQALAARSERTRSSWQKTWRRPPRNMAMPIQRDARWKNHDSPTKLLYF